MRHPNLIGPLCLLAASCASPQGVTAPPALATPPVALPLALAPPAPSSQDPSPISQGELPWWHDLKPGVYLWQGQPVVFAVGRSVEHHHVAEGFLKSKVIARLGVRKAAEPVAFSGTMPEPELSDLFITREQRFFALYLMPVPAGAELEGAPHALPVPITLDVPGRRRLGRHVFEGARHLFLECEVEGPVANPDWGRTRATAQLPTRASPQRTL